MRDRRRERVHHAAEGRALLADVGEEDLPERAVLVDAGGDVALVAADRELVRDRLALARHPRARAGLALGLLDGLGDEVVDLLLRVRAGRHVLALLRVGAQRLRGLRAVAVDRERLDAAGARRRCRRPRCRSTVESCGMLTVLEIAPEMNGWTAPIIVMWPEGLIARSPTATSNTDRSSSLEPGGADDRVVLADVRLDLLDLLVAVAERLQRQRHGAVDDRHLPAADELLELHEREVRLDAGRVAVHEERDRPGRREHGGLRVAVAVTRRRARPRRPTSGARRRAARCPRPSSPGSRTRRRGASA